MVNRIIRSHVCPVKACSPLEDIGDAVLCIQDRPGFFDEVREEDLTFTSEGIELVLEPQYGPLLKGTVIDFVELEPGQFHFIFMNPNDTNCTPPGENQGGGCGCGSGGCSSSS